MKRTMKRLAACALALVLLLSLLPAGALPAAAVGDGEIKAEAVSGDVEAERGRDPGDDGTFLIHDYEELLAFAQAVEEDPWADNYHAVLTANIDASASRGKSWTPICSDGIPFDGVFDGNGHVIRNLTCTADEYVGLFGSVGPFGTVKNVGLESCSFNGGEVYANGAGDGAAIGAGSGSSGFRVTVNGGKIEASAATYGAAIGAGKDRGERPDLHQARQQRILHLHGLRRVLLRRGVRASDRERQLGHPGDRPQVRQAGMELAARLLRRGSDLHLRGLRRHADDQGDRCRADRRADLHPARQDHLHRLRRLPRGKVRGQQGS